MEEQVETQALEQVAEPVEIRIMGQGRAVTATDRAEVETAIATAKRFPRDITQFKRDLLAWATLDEETAASCFYVLPRAGKPLPPGRSIRFAELALSAWKNVIAQGDISHDDAKHVYAVGMCRDLERNVGIRVMARRRITDKNGRRYSDDMIAVTGMAAVSVALRNAILKIIPGAFTKDIFEQVKQVAIGDAKTLVSRRTAALEKLGKMGVTPDRVLAALPKAGVDDIDLTDIGKLIGFYNAIKDGDSDIDTVFPPLERETPKGKKKSTTSRIKDTLGVEGDPDEPKAPDPDDLIEQQQIAALQQAAEKAGVPGGKLSDFFFAAGCDEDKIAKLTQAQFPEVMRMVLEFADSKKGG